MKLKKEQYRSARLINTLYLIMISVVITAGVAYLSRVAVGWKAEHQPVPTEVLVPAEQIEEVYTPEWFNSLTEIEKKVCRLWDVYDCKMAVARCRAESGCDNKMFNFASDDVGAMQINKVHWAKYLHDGVSYYENPSYKEYCDLEIVATEDGNLNCAHRLWKEQGPQIWVADQTGSTLGEYYKIQ